MTNLGSILKSRDIILPTKVHLVRAMDFPVVMYGCESWDYKESWVLKNWCFWTVVLEKTLESPLDYREIQPVHLKGDQSCVFIARTDAEAETPILCHLMQRANSFDLTSKTLMLGKIEGGRRRGLQRMRWLDGITYLMDMGWVDSGSWWWTGRPGKLRFMGLQRVGDDWVTELNWTELGSNLRGLRIWLYI